MTAFRTLRAMLMAALAVAAVARANPPGSITEQPLAPHPFPPGKTMFVPLSPAETGVVTTNNYDDPRMFGDLYQEFEGGSIGTGVALGDYDGDGRPDLFVVSKTESCRLFRNLGNFRFEDVTERAGVADHGAAAKVWKQGVTFADVNNAGLLDIYVCRYNAPNLLYINQGDGTFREAAHAYGLDVKDASVMASFCDYDRDGWLDVYITTNLLDNTRHPNGQRGYLFHNNRDGTFTDVTDRAGISGEACSHSATWWDYDNDGWPDLYVANDYGVPDKLYHNNRDGTFTNVIDRVVPHTSFYSMGSDQGDVNNDGRIDFLVADMATTTHRKDQNSIALAREQAVDPPDPLVAPKYHRSALFLNTGTGRCLEAAYLAGIAATDWTWSPRLEDLDNDGRLDLFVTNGFNRDPNPDVYSRMMNAGSLTERNRIMYDSPVLVETHLAFRNLGDLRFENVGAVWGLEQKGVAFGSAFGDLYGDGNLDLVYSNFQQGVSLFRNDNATGHRVMIDLRGTVSNRFGIGARVKIHSALGVQVRQLWLARGYSSSSEPALHFGLGRDTVIDRLTVIWPSGLEQTFTDLPVDRRYTITEPADQSAWPARGDSTRGEVHPSPAWRADLRVGRAARTEPGPPENAVPNETADSGSGGKIEGAPAGQFAEVGERIGFAVRSREEPIDEASLQKFVPERLNRRGPALAVGTIDPSAPLPPSPGLRRTGGAGASGRTAVVVGGTTVEARRILRGGNAGSFLDSGAATPPGDVDDGPLLLFDATGNGREDLLVTRGGNALPAGAPEYQPKLLLNDGHGGFQPAPDGTLPALSINAGAVAAADFNRDGHLDLFIGGRVRSGQYPLAPRSALLENRGGKFVDVTDALAPELREVGMVTSALWTDVDGDGWPDLLLALEWGGVKYFHNRQGRGFEDWSEKAGFASAGTGWWTSIAAADFNGDGRIDYVVGNVGLNTQYHADPAHPALLFSGDFRGDGGTELIEGYYEGDKLYPWRSRKGLAAVIPTIFRRFPRNALYAGATLEEIVGAGRLAAARRFAATNLCSGVFLSQPDGTYRFEPLPRIAQIAPLQGMVAGDFDGDGHADVYAVQNSYAPIPVVGRFDSGLSQLLHGDGHGHFEAVPPAVSGLVVPRDAKALVAVDLDGDGWADFLVSRNNDTTLAFRNRGVAGRRPLSVALRGPPGNPTAVGARITVVLADGTTQTSEVYAGSGYYSQSTAACFFGYPEGNPPRRVEVRWPSGAITRFDTSGRPTTLDFSEPLRAGPP